MEYAPAFTVPEEVREEIFASSIRLVKHVGYRNAGTLEFLVDDQNHPYFIEMNPRIQVEHTVSEMVTGIDIVQSQIMIAEGYALDSEEIGIPSQEAVKLNGYSIQTRITTEDPVNNFLPDTGRITVYRSGSAMAFVWMAATPTQAQRSCRIMTVFSLRIISYDRTFKGAIRKSLRALKESVTGR